MILHGDSDTGMPFEASSKIIAEMVPGTDVRLYEKAGHGLYVTHAERVLEDIVGFVKKVEHGNA
jgi:pimeloyl-ACP methyl ester carboxylesterase